MPPSGRLLLFRNATLHAMTATADGRWTTVGTANIDRLSLVGNFKLYDAGLAAAMEELFELDLTNARELTPEQWAQRGRLHRAAEQILRPLRLLL